MRNTFDQTPIDRYDLGHYSIGILLGLARVPWWAALGIAVGWELAEDRIKDAVPQLFPRPIDDTFANSALDVAFWMAGWATIKMLPPDPLAEKFAADRRAGRIP